MFETEAKLQGVTFTSRKAAAIPAEVAETIGALAKLYDLTIVAQPEARSSSLYNLVPEAVLFNSGRPMLMVPYIHEHAFEARRIMVCWDGKRAAARAVLDAMPFLSGAETVEIIAINEDSEATEAPAAALATHLARKSIAAKAERLTAERGEIHNTILSAAADRGAQLIVMGGYGHSRLREFVLGGATRGVLQSMTISGIDVALGQSQHVQCRLKYCTARSCRSAAARDLPVPRLRALAGLRFILRE